MRRRKLEAAGRQPLNPREIALLGLRDRSEERDERMRRIIRSIPRGKVATYAQVAAASGYPMYHRHVARLLRGCGDTMPWPRVVGAGGAIRLAGEAEREQRLRLKQEGVRFNGARIDMAAHQYTFRTWEID